MNTLDFNSLFHQTISYLIQWRTQGTSCLVGLELIEKTGMSRRNLIPVTMRMHSADNRNISILGAVIFRLCGMDQPGSERVTRQIIYVTDSTDKFFLSWEACIDMGIISIHFPVIGEVPIPADCQLLSTDYASSSWDIARLPPLPTTLPCPATEENTPKLKQYLIDYYSSSTFNICEHQPLPIMEGPSMRVMIYPKAKPTAYHSPIPVPIHWQDDVKAGHDRDVRLGVLEPVSIGEPVTWCHRMVICAKRNGKPRRTIDFQ